MNFSEISFVLEKIFNLENTVFTILANDFAFNYGAIDSGT